MQRLVQSRLAPVAFNCYSTPKKRPKSACKTAKVHRSGSFRRLSFVSAMVPSLGLLSPLAERY